MSTRGSVRNALLFIMTKKGPPMPWRYRIIAIFIFVVVVVWLWSMFR